MRGRRLCIVCVICDSVSVPCVSVAPQCNSTVSGGRRISNTGNAWQLWAARRPVHQRGPPDAHRFVRWTERPNAAHCSTYRGPRGRGSRVANACTYIAPPPFHVSLRLASVRRVLRVIRGTTLTRAASIVYIEYRNKTRLKTRRFVILESQLSHTITDGPDAGRNRDGTPHYNATKTRRFQARGTTNRLDRTRGTLCRVDTRPAPVYRLRVY